MTYSVDINIEIWALTTALLFFKMISISIVQGYARSKGAKFSVSEDQDLFGKFVNSNASATDLLERANSCWRNDLENIPLFLFLAWACVSVGINTTFFAIACGLFVVARALHTYSFLKKTQPLRTIAYLIAISMSSALAAYIIGTLLRNYFLSQQGIASLLN